MKQRKKFGEYHNAFLLEDEIKPEKEKRTKKLETRGEKDKEKGTPREKPVDIHQTDREPLNDFVTKQREMFLLEYALSVKREEKRKLDESLGIRERELEKIEQKLSEEITSFDEKIKESKFTTNEATKKTENTIQERLFIQQQNETVQKQINGIKDENAKLDEAIAEFTFYQEFLERVSPEDFIARTKAERELAKNEQKTDEKETQNEISFSEILDDPNNAPYSDDLYFRTPEQLISLFKNLEEKNMHLIHRSQESENLLHSITQKRVQLVEKMESDTLALKELIASLQSQIKAETVKQTEITEKLHEQNIDIKSQYTNAIEEKNEEKQIAFLHLKIEDVYLDSVSDNCAGLNIIQMLSAIERKMLTLQSEKEKLPRPYVKEMEKEKEFQRRQAFKAEQGRKAERAEAERRQKAIERYSRPVVRKVGKAAMVRTYLPPKVSKSEEQKKQKMIEEEEDLDYFGLSETKLEPHQKGAT